MEIAEMRQIPITDFLGRLGHHPVKGRANELWYLAPYRNEHTPSFRVNVDKNVWYDFGLGKGGDIFNLAGEFIHSRDFMEQAKFIAGAADVPLPNIDTSSFRQKTLEPCFEDVEVMPLQYVALTGYLAERGIPFNVASQYCSQLDYFVHKKKYFAIGFKNVAGGYEIRNKLFKGCVPPKDVSLIKVNGTPSEDCNVFEGFMDFLSAVTLGIGKGNDHLVLNSVSNTGKAVEHLDGYGQIECYLDNDGAGKRALEILRTHYKDKVVDCSALYQDSKDLNEYLQKQSIGNNNLKIKENEHTEL
jgi:DNA primase